jgi:phage shock protein PspC (stress-responsive transcriptional regulator)
MNKTVTVNIGGMVFHIEEQAYEQLRKYLEAIRGYFTTSDGRDEIIQDIESRIAEMFAERIGTSRQVLLPSDVDHIINVMGRPEQVAGADDESKQSNAGGASSAGAGTNWASGETRGYRRLYRDPDDKVIGGVCSGISNYIGIDPIWLRIAFAAAFFIWGSGLLFYLLLLIIIPKAKTTTEKLEMKGQPVNIDNIKRTIEEEVEDIKSRISGKPSTGRSGRSAISNFFDAIGAIIVAAIKFFVGFIGVILSIVLFAILFALFMSMLAMAGVIGDATLPVFLTESFLTPTQLNLAIVALGLVIGIPVIMILYRITRSLLKIKNESKVVNYSAGILWTIGVIIAFWIGTNIARSVSVSDTQTQTIPIAQPTTDTLHLAVLNPYEDRYQQISYDNWTITTTGWGAEGDTIRMDNVDLDVQRADGDQFELIKITTSRGASRKDAEINANGIGYEIVQDDSVIRFSRDFILTKPNKFRSQKIRMVLKVPVGKSVFIGENMEDIIYDIKNVTNTWDNDMIGHTWTMTNRGLECIGCNLEDRTAADIKDEDVKVRINGKEVDIKSDNDTIDWNNKDVNVKIGKDGVVIDAKEKNQE